jgi:tRNA (guanosine-2'-O-)-methyltransferase
VEELYKLVTPQRLARMRGVLEKRQRDLELVMDYVYSPHNLAAIIRSADAVNIGKVYYRHQTRTKLSREITIGADKWMFIEYIENLEALYRQKKGEGVQIVSTDLTSKSVNFREVDYTKPTLIVVGNEVDGVSELTREYADINVVIPMYGMSQSLNVSVATAVILYEAERQRVQKGLYETPHYSEEEIEEIIASWIRRDAL